MPSPTITAESRWCGALREELELLASSFDLDLDESEDAFLLRSRTADAENEAPQLVARVAKQNAVQGLSGLEAMARHCDAAAIPAAEAEPRDQPDHVHQFAGRLMEPFRLRDGTIHLAGCVVERRPFLRLTLLQQSVTDVALVHRWYDPRGEGLSSEQVTRLGLDDLKPVPRRLRNGDAENVRSWIQSDAAMSTAAVFAVVAWCNWVSGKLRLEFRDGSAYAPFEGWAIEFARGQRVVPPFRCPHTAERGYEVLMLDDGTITVEGATGRCEATGRQVLRSRLRRCAVTGMKCLETELTRCPISGELALTGELVCCPWCARLLLPRCVRGGRCDQCADLRPVVAGDGVDEALAAVRDRVQRWGALRGRLLGDLVLVAGRRRMTEQLLVYDCAGKRVLRTGQRRLPWGSWQICEAGS